MRYCDVLRTIIAMRKLSKVSKDWRSVYYRYVKVVALILMMQLLKVATDTIVVLYFSVLIVIVNHFLLSDHSQLLSTMKRYILFLTNKDS